MKWNEVQIKQGEYYSVYGLECPKCKYKYSPKSQWDGTIDITDVHKFCSKCGEKLDKPDHIW